jgi:hypothetical protein
MNLKLNAVALALPLLAACSSAVKLPDGAQVQSDAAVRQYCLTAAARPR